MEEGDDSATELMANQVMEELQESGERDLIKDWLLDVLESKGWKAYMFQKAAEITAEHSEGKDGDASVSGQSERKEEVPRPPLKTHELAERLSKLGHDSIPSSVRNRLLNQLLKAARRTVEAKQCQPTAPKS